MSLYDFEEVQEELDALYREIADAWDVLRTLGIRDYTNDGMRTVGDGIRDLAGLSTDADRPSRRRHAEHAAGVEQLGLFDDAA